MLMTIQPSVPREVAVGALAEEVFQDRIKVPVRRRLFPLV